jgi:hypothetical protein
MRFTKTIGVLAVSLAASGCSLLEYQPLGKENLKNSQGHVIGYRERLCDCSAGEELDRVVLFTPRLTEAGNVIGYEEKIKNGVVLWICAASASVRATSTCAAGAPTPATPA